MSRPSRPRHHRWAKDGFSEGRTEKVAYWRIGVLEGDGGFCRSNVTEREEVVLERFYQ